LRFYLDEHRLITTRHRPLSATDDLRKAIREGLRVDSTGTLMVGLLECQAGRLGNVAARLNREIGDMEDQILAERVHVPRAKLATLRRLAVGLHRHFAPEHRALQRLCGRSPAWFRDTDIEGLKDTTEALGEIVGDLDAIQERAKLLQEELAGRALKETNRNMVILSVVTAVFMPVTLITGIFGMNVAGLPGLEDGSAFWWVMLGMAGGGLDGAVATALEAVVVAPHLSRKRFRVPYTRRPGIVPAAAGIRSAHPRR
jgi:zinc transporter